MGAVFALFAGWYYWTPKILGLDYNRLLSKVHFWILFVGVNTTGRKVFYLGGKRFTHHLNKAGGSPNESFAMFFENVQSSKRDIYKKLKGQSGVYLFINNITNDLYHTTLNTISFFSLLYINNSVNLFLSVLSFFYSIRYEKREGIKE